MMRVLAIPLHRTQKSFLTSHVQYVFLNTLYILIHTLSPKSQYKAMEGLLLQPTQISEKEAKMVLSEKQEALVKESWELMKQDVPLHSIRLFTFILEKAPAAKDMLSFLRDTDVIPENNPKLRAHAAKVFKLTCESAAQLREKGEVAVAGTTLKWLGSVHLQKGVLEPHFEVVKDAWLRTIKEAVGEKWTEEMKDAWGEAYDHLAAAIKGEMKAQAALSSKPTP